VSVPKDIIRENPSLGDWCILHVYRGSIAHGMYTPSSDPNSIDDKDTMAVCVPPVDYFYGLKQFGPRGTKEIKRGEWDIVVYEARKAISLLEGGNPNVLSMLWSEQRDYIKLTDAGRLLIENRHLFVGKHVYRSFVGYAYSQLHRMEHFVFEGYMGEKRKRLVERWGYDCKNAAHLIRLLRMGIEFLNDGALYVMRHDAPQLLEIKRGEWTLERVKEESTRLFAAAEQAYLNSKLPAQPDSEAINKLCVEVVRAAHDAALTELVTLPRSSEQLNKRERK
jgi:predicted nucleotidyltransferase